MGAREKFLWRSQKLEAEAPFIARLTTTLVPEQGGGIPFYLTDDPASSAALPTEIDNYGIVRTVQIGEASFRGARYVKNLVRQSNNLLASPWGTSSGAVTRVKIGPQGAPPDIVGPDGIEMFLVGTDQLANNIQQSIADTGSGKTDGILRPVLHTVSFKAAAGTTSVLTAQLYTTSGVVTAEKTFTLSADVKRYAFCGTPNGTNAYRIRFFSTAAGTCYIGSVQLEDQAGKPVDGSGNVPPSEYVSYGAQTVPSGTPINVFGGLMVDGAQCFDTELANTLDNATGIVTELTGAKLPEDTLRGVRLDPTSTALTTNGENTLTGWTVNAPSGVPQITVTPSAATGPDGLVTAIRLTEAAGGTGSKFTAFPFAATDNVKVTIQAFVRTGGTRSFVRLNIKDKTGATVGSWFNTSTGEFTSVAAGGEVGSFRLSATSEWYFICLTADIKSGGSTPEYHIGLSNVNNGSSYTGVAGQYVDVWGLLGVQKEHAVSHFDAARWSNAVRTGNALDYFIAGALPPNNFGLLCETFAPWNSGRTKKTNNGTTNDWYSYYKLRANNPASTYSRCGVAIRWYTDVIPGIARIAADKYTQESTRWLLWRPNKQYAVGDWVVPQDTLTDNSNGKKVFKRVVAGVSNASPPSWNTTFGGFTTDGAVVNAWQCIEINTTDGGIYDPNDGAHPVTDFPAFGKTVVGWWTTDQPAFGCAVNGEIAPRTTEPFPIDGSKKGDFIYPLKLLRIGRNSQARCPSSSHTKNMRIIYGRAEMIQYIISQCAKGV